MECNDLEKYIVQIKSGEEIGSGILLKPTKNSKYIYILTAKHVIDDVNNIFINYNFSKELKVLINFSNNKAIDYNDNEIFFERIKNIPEEKHLEIFVINEFLIKHLKPLKISCDKFKKSQIIGYPKATKWTRQCLELEGNQLSADRVLYEVKSKDSNFSFEKSEKTNTKGYSGGGIFFNTNDDLYLAGIVSHVETTAFQGFKYTSLSNINNYLEGYTKTNISSVVIDNKEINRIKSFSKHNYESANIYIDEGNLEKSITLDNLYIERDIETDIFNFLNSTEKNQGVIIKGDAGSGKTSLLWRIANKLENNKEFWFIKASDFFNINNFLNDFKSAISSFVKKSNNLLFILIDTIDLISARENLILELINIINLIKSGNNNVIFILTSRQRESEKLKTLNLKSFILKDYNQLTDELNHAITSYVDCFYSEKQKLDKKESLDKILNAVTEGRSLKEVCSHPLTLRMLFTIYYPSTIPEEINVFKLYRDFWEKRIESDIRAGNDKSEEVEDLSILAGTIALIMLAEGILEIEMDTLKSCLKNFDINKNNIDLLIKRNILIYSKKTISFFHQTFFEHSCARGIINTFKREALNHFENKVKINFDNLFLMPIYEQMLLISDLEGVFYKNTIVAKFKTLCKTNFSSKYSAIYVFTHINNISYIKTDFKELLIKNTDNEALVKRFLSVIYNVDKKSISFVIELIQIVWNLDNKNYIFNILLVLEELSYQNKNIVYNFIIKNNIYQYIVDLYDKLKSRGPILDMALILVRTYIQLFNLKEEAILEDILSLISYFNKEKKGSKFELKTISYLSQKENICKNKSYLKKVITKCDENINNKYIILSYGKYLKNYYVLNNYSLEKIIKSISEINENKEVHYPILIAALSEYLNQEYKKMYFDTIIYYYEKIRDILNPREIIFWTDYFFLNLLDAIEKNKKKLYYKKLIFKYLKKIILKLCNNEGKYFPFVKKILHENDNYEKEDFNFLNKKYFLDKELWTDKNKLQKFLIQGYLAGNLTAIEIIKQIIADNNKKGILTDISFNFLLKKMLKFNLLNKENTIDIITFALNTNNLHILQKVYTYQDQIALKVLKDKKILELIKNYLLNNILGLKKENSSSILIKQSIQTLNFFLEKGLIEKINYTTIKKLFNYNSYFNDISNVLDSYFLKSLTYLDKDDKRNHLDEIFLHVEKLLAKTDYFRESTKNGFELLSNCIISTNNTSKYIERYYNLLTKAIFHNKDTKNYITEYTKNIFYLLTDLMPKGIDLFIDIFLGLINSFDCNKNQFPSNSLSYFSARIEFPLSSFFKSPHLSKKNMIIIFQQLEKVDPILSRGIVTAIYFNSDNNILIENFHEYIEKGNIDDILLEKITNHRKHLKDNSIISEWSELYDLVERTRLIHGKM